MDSDIPANGHGAEAATATSPSPEQAREPVGGGSYAAGTALFRERFEALLPTIQQQWPEVARHTLEATRGSLDLAVEVIARQTGRTSEAVKAQLLDLLHFSGDQAHQWVDSLRPLEDQLEHLLDDLNANLRPRLEKPVRERPLMALGLAAGLGLLTGLLLASGRRSA